jgi:hypothetical protein
MFSPYSAYLIWSSFFVYLKVMFFFRNPTTISYHYNDFDTVLFGQVRQTNVDPHFPQALIILHKALDTDAYRN